MTGSQGGKNSREITPQRRRRIQRLKHIIIGTIFSVIFLLIFLCAFLTVRIYMLQERVNELEAQMAENTELSDLNRAADASDQSTPVSKEDSDSVMNAAESETVGFISNQSVSDNSPDSADGEQTIRKVYLTFDDGPSDETDTILDILEEYNVKATFFVVGKTDSKYDLIYKRIVAEGHTLGMHSYSHNYQTLYASRENFIDDLDKLQQFLYDKTGVESMFYRFPGGSSNTVSQVDMNDLINVLQDRGIVYFDWNVSAGDATETAIDSETIVNNVLTEVQNFPHTAVVLLHDADDKKTTVEALPEIIEGIEAMDDTEILPISEDTFPIQHKK